MIRREYIGAAATCGFVATPSRQRTSRRTVGAVLIAGICLLTSATPTTAAMTDVAPIPEPTSSNSAIAAERISVAIKGLTDDEHATLLTDLDAERPSCPAEIFQAIQFGDRATRAIADSRRSRGDYTPTITTDVEAAPAPQVSCWQVVLTVVPGTRALLRDFKFNLSGAGGADAEFVALAAAPPFSPGQRFAERNYEHYKNEFSRIALERGYFDAAFVQHRVDVYPELHVVDVALHFDTGERYAFGNVQLTAPDVPLSAAFLKRLVPFSAGEPYSAERLNTYRERLVNAGYFASSSVEPDVEHAVDRRVPINTSLQPLPRRAVTAGAGFATDIGPRVKGSYEDRFLTQSGHQFDAQLSLSRVISDASVTYRMPSESPAERWLAFDGGAKRERTETAHSDTLTGGVRQVVVFGSGWRRTLALSQSYERFSVGADRAHTLLLVPSLRFERASNLGNSDRNLSTKKGAIQASKRGANQFVLDGGWSANVVVLGAPKLFLSDLNFLQIHAQGRYAQPLGERARVLLRGEAGSSWVAGFAELPPTYRFFAGGDDSVRGFDFKTLGPRAGPGSSTNNKRGEVRGGKHLLTGSIEYERLFADRWSWAVFTDAGNAFEDFSGTLRYSAGVGIRWHSPVGSIRFDLAHAIDGGQGGLRVHIGIGQLQ